MGPDKPAPVRTSQIFIAAGAFKRLKLYIELCPFEVGGLGTVEPCGEDLLVTDLFLMRQRASGSDTELDSQAVADLLVQTLQNGGDLTALRVWWHSHADGPILWSPTDEETIQALQIDRLVSIVGNKRHEFACRLDEFVPTRRTFDGLPLVPIPEETPGDEGSLRRQLLAELREKVILVHREVSLEPELFFNSSSRLEMVIPFDDQESRHQP